LAEEKRLKVKEKGPRKEREEDKAELVEGS
jgi:hypothetical protein